MRDNVNSTSFYSVNSVNCFRKVQGCTHLHGKGSKLPMNSICNIRKIQFKAFSVGAPHEQYLGENPERHTPS